MVHAEPAPTGDHQANGAAESIVGVLRSKANLLVSQIEEHISCKAHFWLYAWAFIASAWLHNHFSVKRAMTSYERTSGRFYSGKVAMFGETVLGCLKTSLKGLPQWTKGTWLSKTMSNDCHIIGTPTGIFITRSIRRFPDSFQLELLGELTASPWEYGYANLGHRLIYSRRSSLPPGVAVGALGWLHGRSLWPICLMSVRSLSACPWNLQWRRLGCRQKHPQISVWQCDLLWRMLGVLIIKDSKDRVTVERRIGNICCCFSCHGCHPH